MSKDTKINIFIITDDDTKKQIIKLIDIVSNPKFKMDIKNLLHELIKNDNDDSAKEWNDKRNE